MTKILTIESSCDETAAAIIDEERNVLASVIATQIPFHLKFGGVVPEIASRAHLERILPVLDETFAQAGLKPADVDAVAVVNTPGLAGSLLVGLAAAKALCLATGKPLIAINHLQAHVYACRVAFSEEIFPCVGLIASGGHSNLYRCSSPLDFTPLGTTIDDAAGEAFDKVAAMLGLPYPGGPSIQRCAEKGNPKAYPFPRPLLNEPDRLAFSFSGLKTAVRYAISPPGAARIPAKRESPENSPTSSDRRLPDDEIALPNEDAFLAANLSEQKKADLAASFQEAAVDCLVGKSVAALRITGSSRLCIGGGVAANSRFREKMDAAAKKGKFRLFIAPPKLCTDNAVMGAVALERFNAGLFETLDLDIFPGLVRGEK